MPTYVEVVWNLHKPLSGKITSCFIIFIGRLTTWSAVPQVLCKLHSRARLRATRPHGKSPGYGYPCMDDFSIKRNNQGSPSDTPEHWRVSQLLLPFLVWQFGFYWVRTCPEISSAMPMDPHIEIPIEKMEVSWVMVVSPIPKSSIFWLVVWTPLKNLPTPLWRWRRAYWWETATRNAQSQLLI